MSGEAVEMAEFRRGRTAQIERSRSRHPSAMHLTPAVVALRNLRWAVEQAWELIDAAAGRPMSAETRRSLWKAAGILDKARRQHPAGRTERFDGND